MNTPLTFLMQPLPDSSVSFSAPENDAGFYFYAKIDYNPIQLLNNYCANEYV